MAGESRGPPLCSPRAFRFREFTVPADNVCVPDEATRAQVRIVARDAHIYDLSNFNCRRLWQDVLMTNDLRRFHFRALDARCSSRRATCDTHDTRKRVQSLVQRQTTVHYHERERHTCHVPDTACRHHPCVCTPPSRTRLPFFTTMSQPTCGSRGHLLSDPKAIWFRISTPSAF